MRIAMSRGRRRYGISTASADDGALIRRERQYLNLLALTVSVRRHDDRTLHRHVTAVCPEIDRNCGVTASPRKHARWRSHHAHPPSGEPRANADEIAAEVQHGRRVGHLVGDGCTSGIAE